MSICWFLFFLSILIGSKAENPPSLSEQEEPVATARLEISPGEEVEINETSSDGVAAVDYESGANVKEQGTTPIPLTTPIIAAKSEPFSCYHCNNCLTKASMAVQPCDAGVISCYTSFEKSGNNSQIITRGCSAPGVHCSLPDDAQNDRFHTITCCKETKCNAAAAIQPLASAFIFIFNLNLFFRFYSI